MCQINTTTFDSYEDLGEVFSPIWISKFRVNREVIVWAEICTMRNWIWIMYWIWNAWSALLHSGSSVHAQRLRTQRAAQSWTAKQLESRDQQIPASMMDSLVLHFYQELSLIHVVIMRLWNLLTSHLSRPVPNQTDLLSWWSRADVLYSLCSVTIVHINKKDRIMMFSASWLCVCVSFCFLKHPDEDTEGRKVLAIWIVMIHL